MTASASTSADLADFRNMGHASRKKQVGRRAESIELTI